MRSSSFRKTSVSQGSVSPSPSSTLKSPAQSLPPLTGDGESVHEVFRKQSTKIEELEKDNKRLEKDLSDATTRWRKTEEQVEDLREASVDGAQLREQLKQAEEQVASIESLVRISCIRRYTCTTNYNTERGNCFAPATKLTIADSVTSQHKQHGIASSRTGSPAGVQVGYH
jgi:septal ring factor EnvC (AmiA/AmiB activator)